MNGRDPTTGRAPLKRYARRRTSESDCVGVGGKEGDGGMKLLRRGDLVVVGEAVVVVVELLVIRQSGRLLLCVFIGCGRVGAGAGRRCARRRAWSWGWAWAWARPSRLGVGDERHGLVRVVTQRANDLVLLELGEEHDDLGQRARVP